MKKIYLIGDLTAATNFLFDLRSQKIAFTKDLFIFNNETICLSKYNCTDCAISEKINAVIFLASSDQATNESSCAAIKKLDQNILIDYFHADLDDPYLMMTTMIADLNESLQKQKIQNEKKDRSFTKACLNEVLTLFGHPKKCPAHKRSENKLLLR